MKNSNLWSGIFFFCFSVLVCIESLRFDLGKWNEPGGGFLPFFAGAILASLSLYLVVESIFKERSIPAINRFENIRWEKWFLTVASILGYALLLEPFGFILCTLVLMIILLAFVEPQRWVTVFLGATITTVAAYIIFQWTLKAQLPKGIIGF